ncbi:MAG TPA: DUF6069 family protein [Streptosporangiaceae bacterium]
MTAGYSDNQVPVRGGPPPAGTKVGVDAGRLWAGGVATAVVAALAAIVGLLIARGVFHVTVLEPKGQGMWGNASTAEYALAAAAVALVATALMQLLSLAVPAPWQFFQWIMGLLTLIAVVLPFTLTVPMSTKVATGLINLALGIIITSLVSSMAASARTLHARKRGSGGQAVQQPQQQYRQPQQGYERPPEAYGDVPQQESYDPPTRPYDRPA